MRNWTGIFSAGDDAGEMRHVDQEFWQPTFIGNVAKAWRKSMEAGCRSAGYYDLCPVLPRELCTSSKSIRGHRAARRKLTG